MMNSNVQNPEHAMNRMDSQGQTGSYGNQIDRTNMGRQPYEFDSCISTEEAFFGQFGEEIKNGYRHNTGGHSGSNPQEDNTPKAHPATGFHRRTVESINRGLDQQQTSGGMGGFKAGAFTAASRQRTQRLSPKGKSMVREIHNINNVGEKTQGKHSPQEVRGRNQSVKLLHLDNSQGSQKIKSDLVSPNSKKPPSRLKIIKRQSSNFDKNHEMTPLIRNRQSSNGIEMLMDDYSSDLGVDKSTPVHRSSASRQSMASPSEEKKNNKRIGSGLRGVSNGNVNRQQRGTTSRDQNEKLPLRQTESQGALRPVGHAGQESMKLDMKFGWRPEFNDRDRLNRKEAIAIKLTYPINIGLLKQSVRGGPLFSEIYRMNKNQRTLKSQVKKNFDPDFPCRLLYQGYRPSVSIELHMRYGQKASFNEDSQFYDVLIPKNIKNKAIDLNALDGGFHKQTPRSPVDESMLKTYYAGGTDQETGKPTCDLTFDSMFESGNLDLAIQVQPREFNLYLKPDTNTKGYCNWFFFKVKRRPDAKGKLPRRVYQFNIMNMYKKKILYRQEAKPLACTSEIMYRGFIMQELENVNWKSSQFSNIGYGLVQGQTVVSTTTTSVQQPQHNNSQIEAIRDQTWAPNNADTNANNRKQKFYCLAFDYEFQSGQEFVYMASSIPYPYTFLQKTIKTCARLDQASTTLTRSLGGLQIPMLTITNEVINISKKRTVIICGRVHPGETNSSWVLHGMIDYLISKDASHLRDSLVFKIVPMVNPDGVVAGNYRTSFIGKDLNRLYLNSDESNNMDDILKPEITAMKQLIKGCKADDSKGILAFIDVHHHSQKRGAFMFGPSYQMQHSKYQEVRVLPKLISMMLPEIFRFQSCRFKNQSYKENCARLYCDKEQGITYSFCLECSQQGYFTQSASSVRGRHVKYFDQNSLMYLGRKICEASFMLNEMSDVQDQKRDAIQRRRKIRLSKKGKKGTGPAGGNLKNSAQQSVGGRTGNSRGAKGFVADGSSMNGATDFDIESEDRNNSCNMSITSTDFMQSGFNPKIGIKGFIAQMMKKMPSSGGDGLNSDSSRGALRTKNTRPLTHFGSEDAVSEKSEKEEESLSDDGSDGGSSAQDLSEDDHNQVLDQVLDQLMPNRVKKIDPVSAHITITKQARIEPPLTRATRKNVKSANRVVLIDKKLVQKEQLMIPTAAPDLNVNNSATNGNGNANGGVNVNQYQVVSKGGNFEHVKGPTPNFDDQQMQLNIAPIGNLQKANKDEQFSKKAIHGPAERNENGNFGPPAARKPHQKAVQGCFQPGSNQGYISQRQQQNKRRIFSGRYKKQPSKDMFANTGYVPPGAAAQRQNMASNNLKVQYNNIYSMVQSSAAQSTYYAQNQAFVSEMDQAQDPQASIVNRQSLRTAGNLQHSYSHHGQDIILNYEQALGAAAQVNETNQAVVSNAQSINANSPMSVLMPTQRQTYARTRTRASPSDFTGGSRNDGQARVVIPHKSHEFTQTLDQTQGKNKQSKPGSPIESQWLVAAQQQQKHMNMSEQQQIAVSTIKSPGKPQRIQVGHNTQLTGPKQQSKISLYKKSKASTGILSSKDIMNNTATGSALFSSSVEFSQQQQQTQGSSAIDANHLVSSPPPRPSQNLPLSQGGFFHRNQVVGYTDSGLDESLHIKMQQSNYLKQNNPDVIIRTKNNTGAMTQKRKSAIATMKNIQSGGGAGTINRITHKRSSLQFQQVINPGSPQQEESMNASLVEPVIFESFAIAQRTSYHMRNTAQMGRKVAPQPIAPAHAMMNANARFGPAGYVMNEDLQDRIMNVHPISSQLYTSPQKRLQNNRMRLQSGNINAKHSKTVAKKTDALIEPSSLNSSNIMSQQDLLMLSDSKASSKVRIPPQSGQTTRKLMSSSMQRKVNMVSNSAQNHTIMQNNATNSISNQSGHPRSQTGTNHNFYQPYKF